MTDTESATRDQGYERGCRPIACSRAMDAGGSPSSGIMTVRAPNTFVDLVIINNHLLLPWYYADTGARWTTAARSGR